MRVDNSALRQRLFELSFDLLGAIDGDWWLQDFNAAWSRTLGWTTDELAGEPLIERVHPDDSNALRAALARALDSGGGEGAEARVATRTGSWRWLLLTLHADPASQLHHIVARDVTERRGLEDDLIAGEARLKRFNRALLRLSRLRVDPPGGENPFRATLEAAADAIDVDRAGIWLFSDDRQSIECAASFETATREHGSGESFAASDFPMYFRELDNDRVIAVSDVATDPRVQELAPYFRSLGISATLDAPIKSEGVTQGLICFEHRGARRPWTRDEQAFAGSLGDLISLTVVARMRQQAGAALDRSNQRLQQLLEHAPLAVVEWDRDLVVTGWNPSAERIFGWSAEEAMGMPVLTIVPESAREMVHDLLHDVLAGSGIRYSQNVNVTKDGRLVHGDWYNLPTVDAAGRIAGATSLCLDLTERVEAERKLTRRLEAERVVAGMASAFVDAEPEGMGQTLRNALARLGEILDASCGWLTLLAPDDDRDSVVHVWHPDPEAGHDAAGEGTLQGTDLPMPGWWTAPMKTMQPLLVHDREALPTDRTAMRDDLRRNRIRALASVPATATSDGRVVNVTFGFAGPRPDLADPDEVEQLSGLLRVAGSMAAGAIARAGTEQALRESDMRFRTMAGAINQVFWLADPAREVVEYISPACARVFGIPQADVLENPLLFYERVHPEDAPRVQELFANMVDEPVDIEYRLQLPDGDLRWVRTVSFPSGGGPQVVGITEDITSRKEAEAGLREREMQLRQAQKMEAFGQLAGGIAHDFNNLLTAIAGTAQIAQSAVQESDPLWTDLAEIRKAGQRAADLTRQLLAFARRQVFAPVVVTINDTISNMLRMLRRLIRENIDIVTDLDAGTGRICVDPGQLEQVVVNLVVNASDAMATGGRLTLRTRRRTVAAGRRRDTPDLDPGEYVAVEVGDTGIGMAPDVLARVFDPFFTTKPAGIGTGLGLATCYGIVRQSGGAITVESAPGQGTTFTVLLPRVETPATVMPAASPTRDLPGGNETILLVEDEPMVRRLTQRILSRLGYTTLEATDGVDALKLLDDADTGPVEMVVTDVVMPRMGGRELAARVRERHPGTRVLYLSGYTGDTIEDTEPGTGFLQKPFTVEALALRVRALLGQR